MTWTPDLPEITGKNEKELWIHVELLTAREQYKNQRYEGYKAHNGHSSRLPEIKRILSTLIKHNDLFIAYCDINTRHTHLIMLWIDWVNLSPFLKQNIEWGDKYEYYEEDWSNFERNWSSVSGLV